MTFSKESRSSVRNFTSAFFTVGYSPVDEQFCIVYSFFFVLFVGIKSPQYRVLHSKILVLLPSPCQQLVVSWFFLSSEIQALPTVCRLESKFILWLVLKNPSLTYSSRRKDPNTSTKRCILMLRSTLRELGTKMVVSLHKLYHVICIIPVKFLPLESGYQNNFLLQFKWRMLEFQKEGKGGSYWVLTPLHKYNSLRFLGDKT